MAIRQLEKTYDPKQVEERWYQFWTEKGYFHASVDDRRTPYSIVIPPPNITGSLHIGHALNNTLQDILIRWRRMQGRNVLWQPGTDHAGIATQNVVERQLMSEGTSREALGREAFVKRVWDWKAQYGGIIIQQLKRLGASCDWDRLRFTMDEGLSKAVREVFVRLYEDGLIYRGERLINWCPRCLTALSDIEVEHEETKGKLYHIEYPLADDPNTRLVVATTRPETMLGDTAVAVHPEDPRYNHLIGKKVKLPLTSREIPIVGDSILVDREFGTGAVKITPGHDFNDFEAGERLQLPRISLFNERSQLSPLSLQEAQVDDAIRGKLLLVPAHDARSIVVKELDARGFLAGTDPHKMAIGRCYRCKTVVEPYLSAQWFVKIKPLAEPAIKEVEEGRIRLIPEGWINNYLGWMRDIKDWCISRQIWWGHQVPAWYCKSCNTDIVHSTKPDGTWIIPVEAKPIVGRTKPAHCPDCSATEFIRDPDVLDTWFSSALWPFSTLGWPEQTPELKTFYPTSTLVTGLDILFFWVARMIMMGLKFTGQVPFRDVYIHALVRDVEGQKMSKSKGNVIDPLSVMEQYGTDALRFTLASMASPGRDIKLAEERIEGYRNFANKIWNAARFILMNLDEPYERIQPKDRSFPDRWILSRLNRTILQVNDSLAQYRFDQASSEMYQFIWHEYCDWYLELIKPVLQNLNSTDAQRTRQTLVESFETILRLLHPFMPFISEEIWQTLPHQGESLVVRPYPSIKPEWQFKEAESSFALLERVVTLMRTGRLLLNYPPAKFLVFHVTGASTEHLGMLKDLKPHIQHMARGSVDLQSRSHWAKGIRFAVDESGEPSLSAGGVSYPAHEPGTSERVLWLATEGLEIGTRVDEDVDLRKALDRVRKQREDSDKEIVRLNNKLSSQEFTLKAPKDVVTEHRERLKLLKRDQEILKGSSAQLHAMLHPREEHDSPS